MSIKHNLVVYLLIAILSISFAAYTYRAITAMINVPFNEFDEAHRAENAKRMKEYGSFLVPLSGSVYDRIINLRVPFKGNSFEFLYFHLERPPLIYDLMILSTLVFGSTEFAYRLPSFILGLSTLAIFIIFARKLLKKADPIALLIGLLCLLTSADLWLSAQYAQLDTGLTVFLFLSLLSLITFVEQRQEKYLILSGLSYALAILSKGQPAILIIPAIAYLVIIKKISWRAILRFALYSLIFLTPWLAYTSYKFGLVHFLTIFSQFAFTTNANDVVHHDAPIFWYCRWLWDSLRPGWSLFLVSVLIDFIQKKIDWKKGTLLVYILVNFAWLSLDSNKLWWYILPLIPAICFYVYLAFHDYLASKKSTINLSIALVIASRPALAGTSNTLSVSYGLFFTATVFYLLYAVNISSVGILPKKLSRIMKEYSLLLVAAFLFGMTSFFIRFPQIIPYHWNMKAVATYYSKLPEKKCLWIYDVPTESVLFYSNAGEVRPYDQKFTTSGYCQNYLITDVNFRDLKLELRQGNIRLYKF